MKRNIVTAVLVLIISALVLTGCADTSNMPNAGSQTRISAPSLLYDESQPDGVNIEEVTSVQEPAKEDVKISFLAAGDNIIHSSVFDDALSRADETTYEYNFRPMYDGIADMIEAADIAFVNQESPMAGREYGYTGYPNFNTPQDAGDTLVDLGFDIVNIANNHMLDKWESGLVKSMEYWETKDVLLIGGYYNAEDYDNIRVFEYGGIKIAFLSYTYGTNGMVLNSGSKHIIPLINDSDIIRQIGLAKEAGDLVFVSIHWGNEDWFNTSSEQERIGRIMVDNEVDVVIGHHPHVVEKVEWASSESGHKTLMIFSLGNMISGMLYNRNMVGGLATFDIVKEGNGEPYIANPIFVPTVCHYLLKGSKRYGFQVYLMEDYTEELAAVHGTQKAGKFTLETLKNYITSTIDAEFLPEYFKTSQ